jgi:hypothetical protein
MTESQVAVELMLKMYAAGIERPWQYINIENLEQYAWLKFYGEILAPLPPWKMEG